MEYPRNISQFKQWAKDNQGTELFLHYDKRKAVRRYVTLILANHSSVLFLDREGRTLKVKYPKKNHYHFHSDSFSFKTMVFKYKVPEEEPFKQKEVQVVDDVQPKYEPEVLDKKGLHLFQKKMWALAFKYGFKEYGMALVLPENADSFIKTSATLL